MNQPSDSWETRLDELVAAMRDDSLSEEQSIDLQNLLQTQPGARRRFTESMHLSAMGSNLSSVHNMNNCPTVIAGGGSGFNQGRNLVMDNP